MGPTPRLWLFVAALAACPAFAQNHVPQNQGLVVRDGTVGSAPEGIVAPGPDDLGQADYLIRADLGEQRGGNLFHSFSTFSIGSGERATFTADGAPNPSKIDNVISRVTGNDPSEIDGTLHSTIPDADVWLLNPSGVVFGEGAQLDVPGSFHASTGDYLDFGEGDLVRFYADPDRPSVLSTARPEAFGFLGEDPAAAISVEGTELAVGSGETLSLVGGDIVLDGATLKAQNGRVNLAAVDSAGEVVLAPADAAEPLAMRGFGALGESRLQARDDVGSLVDVSGSSPGSVFIRGGKLVVEGHRRPVGFDDDPGTRSRILAENDGEGPGGRISVETNESVHVDNGLLSVDTSSAGDAGTIRMKSPSVTFQNGPGLFHDFDDPTDPRNQSRRVEVGASAATVGSGADSGAGGRIEIEAERSLTLQKGVSVSAGSFGIYPDVATGDGGSIHIEAGSLQVLDRTNLTAGAFRSEGNAGSVEIHVRDTLRLDGTPQEGTPREEGAVDYAFIDSSKYFNVGQPERLVPGALGTIDIEAGVVEVLNGGHISSDCGACTAKRSPGDPPNISIKADRVVVAGTQGVVVGSNAGTEGDAGGIEIAAASLELREGGSIKALTNGAGNAGDITIDADSLMIAAGSVVDAGTRGKGAGGDIIVHADTVQIRQGVISTNTRGSGAAGEISIDASDSILVTGVGDPRFSLLRVLRANAEGRSPEMTGVFSVGRDGSIRMAAPLVTLTDGAIVATSTIGGGDAGDVFLSGDRISVLNGAFVDSTSIPHPDGTLGGSAGDVWLEAEALIELVGSRFGDMSHVSSATLGSGAAGTVTLAAPRVVIDGGAVATGATPSFLGTEGTGGGTLTVRSEELIVRGGGRIDAGSYIAGPGGNIKVTATESLVVEGEHSGIASRAGASGDGGSVELYARVIEVNEGGEISAKSEADPNLEEVGRIFGSLIDDGLIGTAFLPAEASGNAGEITLEANQVRLAGGMLATDAEAVDGGNIMIQAKELVHLDAGAITASVTGGEGGDILIGDAIAPELVILENGSRIDATTDTGTGGDIDIATDNYFAFPGSVVDVDASSTQGVSGSVEVHTPDVNLAGTLAELPTSYLDAASLMREPCAARRSGERAGSFAVRGNGGIPPEPDGWLPASVAFDATSGPTALAPPTPASTPLLTPGSCR